jgi:hypothetical protein
MRSLIPLLFVLLLTSCKTSQDDPRIPELQKDVVRLSEQNKKLEESINELRRGLQESRENQQPPPVQQAPAAPPRPVMTLERMKMGVEPVLEEVIRKIKVSSDTPKKGEQYGMRIEYDLKHAVYGLVQSKDRRAPYAARVIVSYQRFLESQKESREYGSGSQEFFFVYRDPKWVYQERQ